MHARLLALLTAGPLIAAGLVSCGSLSQPDEPVVAELSPAQRQQALDSLLADEKVRADLIRSALATDDAWLRTLADRLLEDAEFSTRMLETIKHAPLRIASDSVASLASRISGDERLRAEIRDRFSGPDLKVSRLAVTDSQGRVRVLLGSLESEGFGQSLYDEAGTERVRVCVENDGTARSRLLTHDGKPAVSAASWPANGGQKTRGGLTLYDSECNATTGDTKVRSIFGVRGLTLFDADLKPRVTIAADNSNGWGGVWVASGEDAESSDVIRVTAHRGGEGYIDILNGAQSRYWDEDGKQRVRIDGDNGSGAAGTWIYNSKGDTVLRQYSLKDGIGQNELLLGSELRFKDKNKNTRGVLFGGDGESAAGQTWFDAAGDALITLSAPKSGAGLAALYRGSAVALHDSEDRMRLTLQGDNGHGWAGAWMLDARSRPRMTLIGSTSGDAQLVMLDSAKTRRASVGSFSDGSAHVAVNDSRGSSAWFSQTDGLGNFRNYRKMTAGEEAWDLAGKASTIGAGLQMLFGGDDK